MKESFVVGFFTIGLLTLYLLSLIVDDPCAVRYVAIAASIFMAVSMIWTVSRK